MPETSLNLQIEKDNTIKDVEGYFTELKEGVSRVNIKLPRHHKMTLFKDSWITSLISNASRGRTLVIQDWDSYSDQQKIQNRFGNSLIGVTSAFMADEISNVRDEKYNLNIHQIVEHIVYDQNGVIEDNESGKSFVFLSFDSESEGENYPKPYALSAATKQDFIRKFLNFKEERIDTRKPSSPSLPFTFSEEWDLPSLIFELYENTSQHGRYDKFNKVIKGVRSFSIKKHYYFDPSSIISQATEFNELQLYIGSLDRKNLRFYEISISDNGMGIVDRLLSRRPEIVAGIGFNEMNGTDQLNCVISKTLSSKIYPGSGLGLTTALRNLAALRGFLSLRTGDQWVCFDGRNEKNDLKLNPVKNYRSLAKITGTHYNILIPATT